MAEALSDVENGPIKQELFRLSNDLDYLEKSIFQLKDKLSPIFRQSDKIPPPPNVANAVQSSSEIAKSIAGADGRILALNDLVGETLRNIEL